MTQEYRGVPVSDLDFNDPQFVAEIYPRLETVRSQGPIVYHPGLKQYLVTGWRDCATVFGNANNFASDVEFFTGLFGGETMECMEKDRHDKVRGIWAHSFQRATIEERRALVAEVVEGQVAPFVERLRSGEVVDAASQMTRRIPTLIIARMLGIPAQDHAQFSAWSDAMTGIAEGERDPGPRGHELVKAGKDATQALNGYIRSVLEERRRHPGDDLVSQMVNSPQVEIMDEQEVVASNTQLVFAGNESTAKLMATALVVLAQHPDQRRQLRANRSLIPQALEEIHRWNTVVQIGWRYVRNGGATVAGHRLEDGEAVLCLQGAGNRDPQRWAEPQVMDIHRPPVQHLGFGFGLHSCLGLNLARLEIEILLNRLLDEVPDWQLEEVDWGRQWILRGPIRIEMAAG